MKTNHNDPINSCIILEESGNDQLGEIKVHHKGLTKREYFAAIAMQGLLSNQNIINHSNFNLIELVDKSVRVSEYLIVSLNSK